MGIVIVHAMTAKGKKKVGHSHNSCGCMMYSRHSWNTTKQSIVVVLDRSTDALLGMSPKEYIPVRRHVARLCFSCHVPYNHSQKQYP